MHGLSIATEVVNAVMDSLEGKNVNRVVEVEVEVGELLIHPEELRFGFQIAARDTPLEGARLILTRLRNSRELVLKRVKLDLRE